MLILTGYAIMLENTVENTGRAFFMHVCFFFNPRIFCFPVVFRRHVDVSLRDIV